MAKVNNREILRAIKNYVTTETEEEEKERKKRQYEAQLQILSRDICPKIELNSLQMNLSVLDTKALKELSQKQFYNGKAMQAILCTMESISYSSDSTLSVNYRLREYFRRMKQIGPPSVQGVAMKTDVDAKDEASDLFVMKVPKDPESSDLYHEAFVGLFGTNKLRAFVPNFAYIFGTFRCSGPVIHGGGDNVDGKSYKEVITWCNNLKDNSPYILYENISPNISMKELARTGSIHDILNAYLQVLYALDVANKRIDFTHYDLHADNVLIRQIPRVNDIYIPYQTEKGREYLRASRIATIIDFGFAHVEFEGKNYGMVGLEQFGIEQQKSLPFHDAYKLLMFILYDRRAAGRSDYLLFSPLVKLVNPDATLDQVIDQQREVFFSLPRLSIFPRITMLDWARQVRAHFPNETKFFYSSPPKGRNRVVASCQDSVCLDYDQTLFAIGIIGTPNPRDVMEFYDLMSRTDLDQAIKFSILKKFKYQDSITNGMGEYDSLISRFKEFNLKQVKLQNEPMSSILKLSFLNNYKDYTQNIANMFDLYSSIYAYRQAIIFTAGQYNDRDTVRDVNRKYRSIIPELHVLESAARSMSHDIKYMDQLQKTNKTQIDRATDVQPELRWYSEYFPFYSQMLSTSIKY